MTSPRSPLDAALDVVLYAPLGLALSAGEEVPRLAAKGRAQVTSRLAAAKVVGQFAVRQGSRQVLRLVEQAGLVIPFGPQPDVLSDEAAPEETGPLVHDPGPEAPETATPGPGATPAPSSSAGGAPPGGESPARRRTRAPRTARPGPRGPMSPPAPGTASGRPGPVGPGAAAPAGPDGGFPLTGVPNVAGLAIPGYDSLSASQVVPRLAGLSDAELSAVEAYELAHRARRTILARITQLRAG